MRVPHSGTQSVVSWVQAVVDIIMSVVRVHKRALLMSFSPGFGVQTGFD
jgi:hypothetical protein